MDQRQTRALIASLAALLAAGCVAMAVAHAGVDIGLLSRLGPAGDDAVPQAMRGFAVAAVVLAFMAFGAARSRPWAWALGTVVFALVVLGSLLQYRGGASLIAIVISVVSLALLLSPAGRAALLYSNKTPGDNSAG